MRAGYIIIDKVSSILAKIITHGESKGEISEDDPRLDVYTSNMEKLRRLEEEAEKNE